MTAPVEPPYSAANRLISRPRRVARNSVVTMAALIVLGGTRVLYGSMISRATDPETYGTVGVLTAVSLILSLILPAGIAAAIARFVPHAGGQGDIERANTVYMALSRVGLIAAAALGVLAAAGAAYLRLDDSQVAQVAILTVVYCLYVTYRAGLYAFDRVRRYAGLEILSSALIILTTVLILDVGSTLYLAPLIVGYAAFAVGAQLSLPVPRSPVRRVGPALAREAAIYVGLACVGTLASAGFLHGTQLLAAQYARLTDVAYFTATITLVSPLWLLPRALGLALFPFMAEAHGAGELSVVRRHADLATRALLALLGPVVVGGILLARDVLVLYGGPPFAGGTLMMQIVLAAAYIGIVQVASVNALSSASGQQLRTPVGWAVAGAASGLALIFLVGGSQGGAGIAIGYLLGTAITAAGPIAVVWHRYGMAWVGPMARAMMVVGLAFAASRTIEASVAAGDRTLLVNGTIALIGVGIAAVVLFPDIRRVLLAVRHDQTPSGEDRVELLLSASPVVSRVQPAARKRP